MIEITNCGPSHIEYQHGPYLLTVWDNGKVWVNYTSKSVVPELHREYEEYLRISLELHKIYKCEEL